MKKKLDRVWHRCVDFPNYEVSRDGHVRRMVRIPRNQRHCRTLRPIVGNGYPFVTLRDRNGVWRKVPIQRLVAKHFLGMTDDNLFVGHAHHQRDSLDDIRLVTKAQCRHNARGKKQSTSRFKGVSWCAERQLWRACIKVDNRYRQLGRFATEEDAACAYDRAAFAAWGEFAFLNFPAMATATE